jgi:hypothetical protein
MFGAEGGGELAESSRDEEVLGGCSCSRTSPRVPWLTLGDEHTNTTNRDRRLLWAAPSGSKHHGVWAIAGYMPTACCNSSRTYRRSRRIHSCKVGKISKRDETSNQANIKT